MSIFFLLSGVDCPNLFCRRQGARGDDFHGFSAQMLFSTPSGILLLKEGGGRKEDGEGRREEGGGRREEKE